ncbi:TIR-NBS-LRR type disease resistance protein [Operophtera brumata]|uniref:TIR-NBS-LRR type disease resistance protein n=1 Tax=Operophtera brumata TaxID=104452 RepID=A0A0L7LPN0_OPEBR|nr:TIR-NBS-LRR type disease resistance protein [Operophtera brumata]
MRMLRWPGGVTLLDKIRNGTYEKAPIADNVKERLLRWYGHGQRRPVDHMVKLASTFHLVDDGRKRPKRSSA